MKGLPIEMMQESKSSLINRWQIVSVAVSSPRNLSFSNTAKPIFSVPLLPDAELVPAVKSSGLIIEFSCSCED